MRALTVLWILAVMPLHAAEFQYRCADGSLFFASFDGGSALLQAFGTSWKLLQTVSASGARYSDGNITLWTKGPDAFIERAGKLTMKDCRTKLPGAAPVREVQFEEAGIRFTIPATWKKDRYTVRALSGPARWVSFDYEPLNSAEPKRSLLQLLVLPKEAGAPPPGAEILSETQSQVYAFRLPATNPYPAATADASQFQSMMLTGQQVRDGFGLLERQPASANWHSVTGTAVPRKARAFPTNAVLIIRIEELTPEGGETRLTGERRYTLTKPEAMGYEVRYDPAGIDPHGRYQVSARIVNSANKLLYVTQKSYPVITGYPNRANLELTPVQ